MMSSFTGKKPDKEGSPVSVNTASSFPPALPSAQPSSTVRPVSALRTGERGIQSVIGPDLTVLGNLVSKGEVTIEGDVQGDLHAQLVVVGEKARVTGGIVADDVVVRGHVLGSIRGKKVQLQATSHVEGDVYHQSLAIEQGAYFEGKSRRSDDPTAGIARPEASNVQLPLPSSQ
jgi:cytoskeletal protein CcmA (bactofilin family)